jgi:hypothetical protein
VIAELTSNAGVQRVTGLARAMFGQLSVMQPPPLQLFSSQNVSLESGQEMNVTFTFDTSQFPLGNYNFIASATCVYVQTNTGENSLQGGNVIVTIPGDVNGDFKVNMEDMVIVARCLGSTPGSSDWNPNARAARCSCLLKASRNS